MTHTNYVRDEHVFELNLNEKTFPINKDNYHEGNRLSIIIDPNNINMNILDLKFPEYSYDDTSTIAFCEGVEDVGEPLKQIEPIAHNRSLGVKSRIKFKIFDKELKYEKKLFDWGQYLQWDKQHYHSGNYIITKNNYNSTSWVLNKNKKYAFIYHDKRYSSREFPMSILWNEYW